jgi:hypothetical protein
MRAYVFVARIAAAIAIKAGHRRRAAEFERASEDVFRLRLDSTGIRGSADHQFNPMCLLSSAV